MRMPSLITTADDLDAAALPVLAPAVSSSAVNSRAAAGRGATRTDRIRRLTRLLTVSFTAALAVLFVGNATASAGGPYRYAAGGDIGHNLTVCAQDLGVRSTKAGPPFNYLRYGQTFHVLNVYSEFGSEWVWGIAYGNVNAGGYVQNGWFC